MTFFKEQVSDNIYIQFRLTSVLKQRFMICKSQNYYNKLSFYLGLLSVLMQRYMIYFEVQTCFNNFSFYFLPKLWVLFSGCYNSSIFSSFFLFEFFVLRAHIRTNLFGIHIFFESRQHISYISYLVVLPFFLFRKRERF